MAAIAKFTNGKLCAENAEKVVFGMFELEKPSNEQKHRKLVAETSHMTYVGNNNIKGDEAPPNKYMLAVRDKRTGKIQVYDTDMFHMKPYFPDEEVEKETNQKAALNLYEKSTNLTIQFGSSKKVRAIKRRIKSQITSEVLESALASAATTALTTCTSDVTEIHKESESASAIPPYDIDATDPSEVYKLDDIISPGEQAVMEDSARPFIDCTREQIMEWEAEKKYPLYIMAHLKILPISERPRKERACLLMYLNYMFNLFTMKAADLSKKEPFAPEVPNMVKRKLLETYTVLSRGKHAIPARLKDKLLSYIIVLCLFIDQFSTPLNILQLDLKCAEKKLMQVCCALGCKIGRMKGEEDVIIRTAKLVVPLVFPQVRQRKMKAPRS